MVRVNNERNGKKRRESKRILQKKEVKSTRNRIRKGYQIHHYPQTYFWEYHVELCSILSIMFIDFSLKIQFVRLDWDQETVFAARPPENRKCDMVNIHIDIIGKVH